MSTIKRISAPTATRGAAPSRSPPDVRYTPGIGLSHALAWFSIGLGVAELVMPRKLSVWTGVRSGLLRACGGRELASGLGILASQRPTAWLWLRVAGDALDLAALAKAIPRNPGAVIATAAVAGVMALDVLNGAQMTVAERLEG